MSEEIQKPIDQASWNKGVSHARAMLGIELMNQLCGDKLDYIERLYQEACRLKAHAPLTLEEIAAIELWGAYSEALRHVLNILKFTGDPAEAYRTLIKNSMPMENFDKLPPVYHGH